MSAMTALKRKHRASLAPVIDRLVHTDDADRMAVSAKINQEARLDLLLWIQNILIDLAKRTLQAETRRGAILSLLQLQESGAVGVLDLALHAKSAPVREAATDALMRYEHLMQPKVSVAIFMHLQVTKAGTSDPQVALACEELLKAKREAFFASRDDPEIGSTTPSEETATDSICSTGPSCRLTVVKADEGSG